MTLSITSPAFSSGEPMPSLYTCEGQNVSPPLQWSGAPAGTRSLVLIVDDPDAPDPRAPLRVWVHWMLYDLPADSDRLPEAVAPDELPPGTREGLNDWKRTGYRGPCPPIGRHRYFHKLYALDVELRPLAISTREELEKVIQGHVLARAELMGTYQRRTA